MDESTKQKQTYLRTEILEKGYDPSKFVEYLSLQKTDGEDIDTWKFEDLKNAVSNYIKSNPKPDQSQNNFTNNDGDDSVDEDENEEQEEKQPRLSMVQQSSLAEEEARKFLLNDEKNNRTNDNNGDDSNKDESSRNTHESSSLNDKRQEMKKALIAQSDVERAAMNDFTYDTTPSKPPKLNELNGEKRLKIKISEQ